MWLENHEIRNEDYCSAKNRFRKIFKFLGDAVKVPKQRIEILGLQVPSNTWSFAMEVIWIEGKHQSSVSNWASILAFVGGFNCLWSKWNCSTKFFRRASIYRSRLRFSFIKRILGHFEIYWLRNKTIATEFNKSFSFCSVFQLQMVIFLLTGVYPNPEVHTYILKK